LSALTDIQPLLNHYDGALEIRKFWDESLIRLQGLADQEAFNAKFAHDERYLTALADAAGNMVTDLRACLELFAQEKTPPAGAG
jgi:hypothetical protein